MVSLMVASVLALCQGAEGQAAAAGPAPEAPASQAGQAAAPAQPTPQGPPPGAGTAPPPSAADDAERKKLEEQIAKELGATPGASPQAPPAAPAQPAQPGQGTKGTTGGNPFARVLMLPDISAIGDFALAWNSLDVPSVSPRPEPYSPDPHTFTPIFQEVELGLQSVVDPYARADVFISFSPDGVDVEEAYLTTLSLPWGFQIRAGKLLSPYGRLNQQHPHVWDFVDAPLAMSRLVAPEALSGTGADLAWLAPLPWFAELHVAYQMTAPTLPEGIPQASYRTALARLLQYFDLFDGGTLGVGLSGARVALPGQDGADELGGADLFLKIRPPAGRAYVVLQGEAFVRRLTAPAPQTSAGGYAQAAWRESAYVELGGRWETAPAVGGGTEQRWSALATWFPSEFQRLRFQVALDDLPGSRLGWEGLLHLEFVIGAHGAHPF